MTTTIEVGREKKKGARGLDLDALGRMDVEALGELYRKGTTPDDLRVLEGHPRGRMLAVKSLDHGRRFRAIRGFASAPVFPWGGKSFSGRGTSGTGINRVHLLGRHQLFPFHTRIQPSVIDGAPCVALDYDLPDNPALIRAIHDEVREVEPGLFLGPAMAKLPARLSGSTPKTGPSFVLWFALDTRVQAKPIGLGRDAR
jgi:hypothetical protein